MCAGSTPNWAVLAAMWFDFFVFVIGWLSL